jgi:glutathione S-transferase
MSDLTLYIGSKNLSSWSLRPWLLLTYFDVPFREVLLPLDTPEFEQRIGEFSPTRRVPVLHTSNQVIWDSLAICEYVNEVHLHGKAYPSESTLRALARSVVCEMHSGFSSLRREMPMNLQREGQPPAQVGTETLADIRRIHVLWRELLGRHGGPYLLGQFGLVDCFFAPVCTRFISYGVELSPELRGYVDTIMTLPAMQRWRADAMRE